jgi:putative thioredoxin
MGTSVEVNSQNFETAVLQASFDRPVLVDFFAQWCGPCQMLKPLLEKLVQEYDFELAKVDIDQSPDLAHLYGVEGVPDVRVVMQGQVQPGFVGMLPEPKLREFLAQLNLQSSLETDLAAVQVAIAAGETETAQQQFTRLLEQYPQNRRVAIAAARFRMSQQDFDSAEQLLSPIQESEKEYYPQAKALRDLAQLKQASQTATGHTLDQPFFHAVDLVLTGAYEAALQAFLTIVAKDRKYRNDGARKAMIMVFDLIGDENPLTRKYRKQLTQTLY